MYLYLFVLLFLSIVYPLPQHPGNKALKISDSVWRISIKFVDAILEGVRSVERLSTFSLLSNELQGVRQFVICTSKMAQPFNLWKPF